jgi:hypothetical protein
VLDYGQAGLYRLRGGGVRDEGAALRAVHGGSPSTARVAGVVEVLDSGLAATDKALPLLVALV